MSEARPLDQDDLTATLALFWHPVCTLDELRAARPEGRGPLAVEVLGRRLAIADLPGQGIAALADRCRHRSTRLSVGFVDDAGLRCAYHGWCFGADGACTDIPSLPGAPIPARAAVPAASATVAYGLVWVRLDDRAGTTVPACPAWDDPSLRIVAGPPYTWPTAAPRRVENFVDLAHFAWVHDGTLGRRDQPVPPLPAVARVRGELRFTYDPPEMSTGATAMYGASAYRMPMPSTVNIEFVLGSGARRVLWMTACPVTPGTSRSFWLIARDDDLDGDDDEHLAFQRIVLAEDEPVVCHQDPPELPLDPGDELSVRTDRVSIEYRRWLRELVAAHRDGGPEAVAERLATPAPAPVTPARRRYQPTPSS